jgi:hypothetical protein
MLWELHDEYTSPAYHRGGNRTMRLEDGALGNVFTQWRAMAFARMI